MLDLSRKTATGGLEILTRKGAPGDTWRGTDEPMPTSSKPCAERIRRPGREIVHAGGRARSRWRGRSARRSVVPTCRSWTTRQERVVLDRAREAAEARAASTPRGRNDSRRADSRRRSARRTGQLAPRVRRRSARPPSSSAARAAWAAGSRGFSPIRATPPGSLDRARLGRRERVGATPRCRRRIWSSAPRRRRRPRRCTTSGPPRRPPASSSTSPASRRRSSAPIRRLQRPARASRRSTRCSVRRSCCCATATSSSAIRATRRRRPKSDAAVSRRPRRGCCTCRSTNTIG